MTGHGTTDGSAGTVSWARYVAVGDSFTEGLWDVPGDVPSADPATARTGPAHPAQPGLPIRGWADRLAESLSRRRVAAGRQPLEYANLAVRGRLLRPILAEQVPAAVALGADLVSLAGGGNDMLRPAADPERMAANLDAVVARLRARGIDVLLSTGVDPKESPLVRRTRGRVAAYNASIWSIAARRGAKVLDLWGMPVLRDWRMWHEDRIHATPEGHHRIAQAALVALGLEPDDPDWQHRLPPTPAPTPAETARWNTRWATYYAYPWATRRLHRRSSGDERVAKRPELVPVLPAQSSTSTDSLPSP